MTSPNTDSNLMTRDEFLRQVLYSGQLTRIAQHVALVVFLVAEGRNQLKLSLRDIERITGWDHKAIKEHVDELEIFMRVTLGTGRAKALWELQGVVEDALAKAVVVGSKTPQRVAGRHNPTSPIGDQAPTTGIMAPHDPTSVVPAHVPTNGFMYRHVPTNGFVAAHVATSLMAAVVPTTGVMAADVPTKPAIEAAIGVLNPTTPPSLERERESNNSNTLSHTSTPRDEADPIQLNGVAIYGPDFSLSYASIDQAAFLVGMSRDRARAIAEIHARDWAMNGKRPDYPMAMIRKHLKTDVNEGQVQEIKIEKARGEVKSKESAGDKIRRFAAEAEEQMKKGGRP